jgi:thiol-disulfide isomerase/thioredoxin
LFLRPDCPACNESLPFYRDLIQQKERGYKVHIVCPKLQAMRVHLEAHNVTPDNLIEIPTDFKIKYTPTLLIVDSTGKVTYSWIGTLNGSEMKRFENSLWSLK